MPKAFLLPENWLRRKSRPRLRLHRVAFFLAQRRRVLAPEYRPSLDELMVDYLAANPTRNRDLDFLTLLYPDERRVR